MKPKIQSPLKKKRFYKFFQVDKASELPEPFDKFFDYFKSSEPQSEGSPFIAPFKHLVEIGNYLFYLFITFGLVFFALATILYVCNKNLADVPFGLGYIVFNGFLLICSFGIIFSFVFMLSDLRIFSHDNGVKYGLLFLAQDIQRLTIIRGVIRSQTEEKRKDLLLLFENIPPQMVFLEPLLFAIKLTIFPLVFTVIPYAVSHSNLFTRLINHPKLSAIFLKYWNFIGYGALFAIVLILTVFFVRYRKALISKQKVKILTQVLRESLNEKQ